MQWIYWLLAVLLSLGAGYWVYRADRKRAVPYPWLTAALRMLAFLLLFLLLLLPPITLTKNETQQPVIVLLQDNSASVAYALQGDTAAYRQDMQALLDKLRRSYRIVPLSFGADVHAGDSLFTYTQPATDIAAALARAADVYGRQNIGAVILASDGRYNRGVNPMLQQLPVQAPLYAVALGDSAVRQDLAVRRVYANKTVGLNSRFEIRADIVALLSAGYRNSIRLVEDGAAMAEEEIAVVSDRYDRSVSFSVKAARPGLHHYIVRLPPAAGEQNTENNRRDVFVEVVDEQQRVLIVAAAPHPDVHALREALDAAGIYRLTVRTSGELPAALDSFSVIILHNLPVRREQAAALRASGRPFWLTGSMQPGPAVLRQLQDAAGWQPLPAAPQTMLPAYNPSFMAFTVPAGIRAVADKLPPLYAPAGMVQPLPGAEVLLTQRAAGATSSAPLWWLRPGSRPIAVLAGEGLWRWRLQEYRHFNGHDVVDECIRQTVHLLAAAAQEQPFRATPDKYIWSDQEAVSFSARLLNANNEAVNTPEATLAIKDSAGREQSWHFERAGNAYRLNTGVRQGGHYTYTATAAYNGRTYVAKGGFAVESVPLERMETGADYALLYSLSRKYAGGFVPYRQVHTLYDSITANTRIAPVIRTTTSTMPLVERKWYFFLFLLCAAAEWLLRKYWLAQ